MTYYNLESRTMIWNFRTKSRLRVQLIKTNVILLPFSIKFHKFEKKSKGSNRISDCHILNFRSVFSYSYIYIFIFIVFFSILYHSGRSNLHVINQQPKTLFFSTANRFRKWRRKPKLVFNIENGASKTKNHAPFSTSKKPYVEN